MHELSDSAQNLQDIDLSLSEGMNEHQQAHFLQVQPSCTGQSEFDRMLPHLYYPQGRDSVLFDKTAENYEHFFTDLQLPQLSSPMEPLRKKDPSLEQAPSAARPKKSKGKNRRDYDKNICGYITKKVVREFLGGGYSKEIKKLLLRYNCDWQQCRGYFGKKVQNITGPSHLPQLFSLMPGESTSLAPCKQAFRDFYGWFLQYRYLRYLILEGKMTDKLAYIEYKNAHLFKYVEESSYDFGTGREDK